MPGRARWRGEDGFGLIELLISMTILVVALMAMFATFATGFMTTRRANIEGTASVLADRTMEAFRGGQDSNITVGTTTFNYSATSTPPRPGGRTYRVTALVTAGTAANTTDRSQKFVTITVFDGSTGKALATESSDFDPLADS